jgi:A/G-specific adenine glycosylase
MTQLLSEPEAKKIREKLVNWGKSNYRKFPWRNEPRPFWVLIAEILLQKTQAEQVRQVYEQIRNHWPTPEKLKDADKLDEVIKEIGLVKRADFIRNIAQEVADNYDGELPSTSKELKGFKGVGDYTANAVMNFGFQKGKELVDSGIGRIFRRLFSLDKEKPAYADRRLWGLSKTIINKKTGPTVNYALLDLSAKVCTTRNPHCEICPLSEICDFNLGENQDE